MSHQSCHILKGVFFAVIVVLFSFRSAFSQSNRQLVIEKIIGELYENSEAEFDYSELSDRLNEYFNNPINLNAATTEQLQELMFLSEPQISAILEYRRKYKGFTTFYELRLIDELDDETINKLLNFITISPRPSVPKKADYYLPLKNNYLSIRTERSFVIKNGFNPDTNYLGNPFKYYLRFYHQPDRRLSYGITMEKDAGEEFFKGTQKKGFDFYSAHFFFRPNHKHLKTIAFGDYYANFGQGLVLSNSFNFGKTPYIDQIFVSRPYLSPYRSANEKNYFRGAAASFQFSKFMMTAMYSNKYLDAGLNVADTFEDAAEFYVSSFDEDGLHRTNTEILNKNTVNEQLLGLNLSLNLSNLKLGITSFYGWLDQPMLKNDKLYNYYQFSGKSFFAAGINYSYVIKGLLFFGETATNGNGYGWLSGVHTFLNNRMSYLLLLRNYSPNYYSPYANAFRENSEIENESGIFTGLNWNISKKWGLTFYYDQYRFPWLKYLVNRPSFGNELLLAVSHQMNFRTKQNFRIRYKLSEKNISGSSDPIPLTGFTEKYFLRYQIDYQVNTNLRLSTRIEYCLVGKENHSQASGFLTQQDVTIIPSSLPLTVSLRYALFTVNDYEARIYSYEADIPGIFSSAMYYRNGMRAYLLIKYQVSDKLAVFFKTGRTEYFSAPEIPENSNQTKNWKNELKFLINCSF